MERGSVFQAKPRRVFAVEGLYIGRNHSRESSQEQGIVDFERELGDLEKKAAPAIRCTLKQIRSRKYPQLSLQKELALKLFLYSIAARTPESQGRLVNSPTFADIFRDVCKGLASEDEIEIALQEVREKVATGRYLDADFAILKDARARQEARRFSESSELNFLLIAEKANSFVIGSHGIGILCVPSEGQQGFLPLAHDVCVLPTSASGNASLRILNREQDSLIRQFNICTATQSSRIAGRSKALVWSLVQR